MTVSPFHKEDRGVFVYGSAAVRKVLAAASRGAPKPLVAVRHGLTRTVLLAGPFAVKIPRLGVRGDALTGLLWCLARGLLANQSEADWWSFADADARATLCPVHLSLLGGLVNVYERCEPYTADAETAMKMFERAYRPVDTTPCPGDVKPDNLGWLDGRLVWLDYDLSFNGCPHDRSGARNRLAEDDESADGCAVLLGEGV